MKIGEFYNKLNPAVSASRIIFKNIHAETASNKVKEIAETTNGGTPLKNRPEFWGGDIPWLNSGQLKDGLIRDFSDKITELGLKKSSAKIFPKGTLVVAMYGATVGKVGILNFESTTNQAVCAVFPDENVVSRDFLYWFFRQKRFDFLNESFGGAQPNISQKVIKQTEIPIPGKKTQEEIVDLLNQIEQGNSIPLFAYSPEINRLLNKFLAHRKAYDDILSSTTLQFQYVSQLRQAILQEAIQGDLTKEWRKAHPDVEPAGQLLERIQKEKERLIEEKQIKKEKPLPPVSEEEKPFELPEGWVWCRFGEPSINRDGERIPLSVKERENRDGPYDYFGASGAIDKIDNYLFDKDLLLIGEDGANLINRATPIAYIASGKYWVNNHAHVIDATERILLDYLCIYINAISLVDYITGMAQPKMPQKRMNKIVVSLPPLEEQKAIVEKVDQLMNYCDDLESQVKQSQTHAEQLMEAVLKEVFEGGAGKGAGNCLSFQVVINLVQNPFQYARSHI